MSAPLVRKGKLIVYLLGRRVGALDYSSHHNEMRFAYDADYLAGSEPMPLSQSLPPSNAAVARDTIATNQYFCI